MNITDGLSRRGFYRDVCKIGTVLTGTAAVLDTISGCSKKPDLKVDSGRPAIEELSAEGTKSAFIKRKSFAISQLTNQGKIYASDAKALIDAAKEYAEIEYKAVTIGEPHPYPMTAIDFTIEGQKRKTLIKAALAKGIIKENEVESLLTKLPISIEATSRPYNEDGGYFQWFKLEFGDDFLTDLVNTEDTNAARDKVTEKLGTPVE